MKTKHYYINYILNIFNKPIENNTVFFLFMIITGTFCIIFEPGFGQRKIALLNLYSDLYILCAVLAIIPIRIRRIVRFVLYVILYGVALFDLICYVRINTQITPLFIQLVEQTNYREATEALDSYLTPSILFSKVGILLLIIIANIVVSLKYIPKLKLIFNQITGSIFFILFVICFYISKDDTEYKYYRILCKYDNLTIQNKTDLELKTRYYIPIWRLIYSLSENERLKTTITELSKSINKASIDSCSHLSPNIVLIIGESLNKQEMSLYGNHYPTTPFQVEREKKGELIKFNNSISSWNATCQSFQNMLSTWNEGEKGDWYNYPLFPEIFRKAGYRVTFISNQYIQDALIRFSDFEEDVFINNKEVSDANFDERNKNAHQYDGDLLSDYNACKKGKYNLTIFHFLGVHVNFNERYPSKFCYFKPSDYNNRKDLSNDDKSILADYDNAIRYNDYVINNILSLFENTETIAIFISDHGERVFQNCNEWGRTLSWNKNDIKQQFCIPMWIWFSKSYKKKHKDIVEQVVAAKDKKYMTDILPHLLFHIAGINTKYYIQAYDILSPSYNENRKRIIRNEKDFDEIMKK